VAGGHDVEADTLPVPMDGQLHIARDGAEDRQGLLEFSEHVIVAGGHGIRLLARDRRANNGDGRRVKPELMAGSVTCLSAARRWPKPQTHACDRHGGRRKKWLGRTVLTATIGLPRR
jgi:hypothetical protein